MGLSTKYFSVELKIAFASNVYAVGRCLRFSGTFVLRLYSHMRHVSQACLAAPCGRRERRHSSTVRIERRASQGRRRQQAGRRHCAHKSRPTKHYELRPKIDHKERKHATLRPWRLPNLCFFRRCCAGFSFSRSWRSRPIYFCWEGFLLFLDSRHLTPSSTGHGTSFNACVTRFHNDSHLGLTSKLLQETGSLKNSGISGK